MQISKKSNIPGSESTFIHLKERPSNQVFQLFFKLHGTRIENMSFFSLWKYLKAFKSISEVQSQTVGVAAIYKTALFPLECKWSYDT